VTVALREQSGAVSIVFTQVVDPVGQGLVSNLAHPGGNVTGFTSFEYSIGTKWLETLKQTAPRVTRIALLFNPESAPFADLFIRPVEAAAPSFSVALIRAAVRDPIHVPRIGKAASSRSRPGGPFLIESAILSFPLQALRPHDARTRARRPTEFRAIAFWMIERRSRSPN
jgi:putative ABC transport system substrate-binding protein